MPSAIAFSVQCPHRCPGLSVSCDPLPKSIFRSCASHWRCRRAPAAGHDDTRHHHAFIKHKHSLQFPSMLVFASKRKLLLCLRAFRLLKKRKGHRDCNEQWIGNCRRITGRGNGSLLNPFQETIHANVCERLN